MTNNVPLLAYELCGSSLRGNIDRMRAHGTGEADARIQIIEWNDELFEKQCKPDVDDYILYKKIYI